MDGIKGDISINMKLAKMQREINALTPVDCEQLCQDIIDAKQAVKIAEEQVGPAEELEAQRQLVYDNAVIAENAATENLTLVIQQNQECLDGCVPPTNQECIDECNNEFNVGAAQADLEAAEMASQDSLNELLIAQQELEAALTTLQNAEDNERAAMDAAEKAGCQCE